MKLNWLLPIVVLLVISPVYADFPAPTGGLPVITEINADELREIGRIGEGWLSDVNWSPVGDYIAAAGSLGVWVYDANDLLATPRLFDGHNGVVWRAAFNATGEVLASAGGGQLLLWDVSNGTILREFDTTSTAFAFNLDGSAIAFEPANTDEVILVSVETGKELTSFAGAEMAELFDLQFSEDAHLLMGHYGNYRHPDNNTVKVWDVATGAEIFAIPAGEVATRRGLIDFRHDLITSDTDGYMRRWNIQTGELSLIKAGYMTLFSDEYLVTTTLRKYIYWDSDVLPRFSVAPDFRHFALLSDNLEIWHMDKGLVQSSNENFVRYIDDIVVDEAHSILAAVTDNKVTLWDITSPEQPAYITRLNPKFGAYSHLQFSENGGLVVQNSIGEVSYFSEPLRSANATWVRQPDSQNSATIPLDYGRLLVVTLMADDGQYVFETWNLETGETLQQVVSTPFIGQYDRIDYYLYDVALNPASNLVATAGTITRLWDMDTMRERATLFDYTDGESIWATGNVAFSSDGNTLATGIYDYGDGIILWDISKAMEAFSGLQDIYTNTGSRLNSLKQGYDRHKASFFADDHLLITVAGGDSNGIIWNTSDWTKIGLLEGHRSSLAKAVVYDNRLIITASSDGTIRLWGVPSND